VVDSKLTTNAFNSNRKDITEFGHIITTCQDLLSSHYTNSSVKFSMQQTNVVAQTNVPQLIINTNDMDVRLAFPLGKLSSISVEG